MHTVRFRRRITAAFASYSSQDVSIDKIIKSPFVPNSSIAYGTEIRDGEMEYLSPREDAGDACYLWDGEEFFTYDSPCTIIHDEIADKAHKGECSYMVSDRDRAMKIAHEYITLDGWTISDFDKKDYEEWKSRNENLRPSL